MVFAIITVMLISIFAILPKLNNRRLITNSFSIRHVSGTNDPISSNALSALVQAISNLAGSAAQAISPPKPPGVIASAQTINSTVWLAVAANAWAYFQPGVGVDSTTGLPLTYFTDWDLGVYIQAVIDANKTGLIGTDGACNSSAIGEGC